MGPARVRRSGTVAFTMERLHILDGYGYIFRAHYGLVTAGKGRQGVRLTTAAGMPTGALYVYAQMLLRLFLDEKPERICVVFDAPGPTFRDDLDDGYKAHRSEAPDDLKVQFPYFRPLTEALSWPVLAVPGVEADDVIATLAARARERDWEVVIYSGDKDLMQLVGDGVVVIDAMRNITYDRARVEEKFGVPPERLGEFLALVGDTSDNVPGVAGVGQKTAAKLLGEHGSLDKLLAQAHTLRGKLAERFADPEQLERLALSRKLVTLVNDVDLGCELDTLVAGQWQSETLRALFEKLELTTLIARLDATRPEIAPEAAESPAVDIATAEGGVAMLDALARAAQEQGKLCVVVETDGGRDDRAELTGIAAFVDGQSPVYVPLGHRYLGVPPQLAAGDLPASFREVLADPHVEIVAYDAKMTERALVSFGLRITGLRSDPMLAAYLLDPTTGNYPLARVIAGATGESLPTRVALLGKGRSAKTFEQLAVDAAADYAGRAVIAVSRAANVLDKRLETAGLGAVYRDLELPLCRVLAAVEETGITVDLDHLRALSDRVSKSIAEIEREVFEIAGDTINLGSPKQLSTLLFDKLGLVSERMKKTKTGYSTDAEVLESLRTEHPIVAHILDHRELCKLKGTYIDALPPLVNPHTGRLHTTFRQTAAATGRLSSNEPNLQNIPIRTELGREIRRAFVAAPGQVLVSADYSQIELRVLAHLSGDPVLLRAFADNIDVHAQTAAEVFGISLDAVGDGERRVAKAVNYGLVYGQSDFGLSRALGIPRAEAKHYIERYFERFSRVAAFMEEVVANAREAGGARTILGRFRPIPELFSKNFRARSQGERIAQNTPMQGSAADIMKLAMLRVFARTQSAHRQARMLLTVHDELVIETPEDSADTVAAAVADDMARAYELSVPLEVETGIAKSWADAH